MIIVRKSEERRHSGNKGQSTWMTFDLENEADPLQKGFGILEILNEEILSPASGFILHTHKNMVVVTYLLEGVIIYTGPLKESDMLESKDVQKVNVTPDTKQYAFNVSQYEDAHVFQSGFASADGASSPDVIKKLFTHAERQGVLRLIASPDGREGSLPLRQDVYMFSTFLQKGNHTIHELKPDRSAWIHVVKGQIRLNGLDLQTGDGAGFFDERAVSFTANSVTEILLFDLGGQIPEDLKNGFRNKLEAVGIA